MRFLATLLPATALATVALSPTVPTDVSRGLSGPEIRETQRAVDAFAWDEFVAIQWPARADQRGVADTNKPFGAEGLRVWETWKTPGEIFLRGGAEPLPWSAPLPHERELTDNLQAVQSDGTLPATLTDRFGHVVRYEIRVNQVLFDYLRSHKLYDSRQQRVAESVRYPDGAMAVKASWRELEPGEEAHYLTRECVVFDTKNGRAGRKRKRKMGLVGLHIVQKTPSAPQWVWATFEHISNTEGSDASFCPPLVPEARTNKQTEPGVPNLVQRLSPLRARLRELNRAQQQVLHATGSVLQNYELVGAQWPAPGGRVEPTFLSNTTMESFVQESSCLGCHASARTLNTEKYVSADFLFSIRRAQPEVKEMPLIPPPTKAVTEWDKKNWRAVQRGHALAERSYELMPRYVGNKLHCGSCHLDVGRNPSSSWWVGMFADGKYETPQKFYDRINQCMQRSMNGRPLPTDGPEMAAFNAYFHWLDEQAQALGIPPQPTGMLKVEKRDGDPVRGKELFAQRCAACHSTDGSGRYESGSYYRPALWGPRSFNNLAGLGAKPEKMAGFLKHNMPFGSGGALTLQESWDLTAFLIAQPRPVKQ
ncbi:c-type cytochrome [Armatimonas rosea]|uniref:Cytochrome c n=1 Tax=Armatimonas rosea TaxID=685828 RepID=A0A7W9SLP7_ARMRO|nr:c-type cytochrome [Armatimonas rosea]MBB6048610.1 cytochrome c [Armatimonas rosea]